eukprot:CAMPEP_0204449254 /NCGR_PEP_ID=MMETSP0470-20130426/99741_1 /ASSEMBLY_ACC=CAM_ASM_000385 /TAXON_ID=2969 /ORGANISM="Oxyrrhis marina" /LENGTH=1163 /DNA_ID=CAMNT_0051449069 /DNA_START=63 /DNA_END=3556 /DNA_ORIENTATION=-
MSVVVENSVAPAWEAYQSRDAASWTAEEVDAAVKECGPSSAAWLAELLPNVIAKCAHKDQRQRNQASQAAAAIMVALDEFPAACMVVLDTLIKAVDVSAAAIMVALDDFPAACMVVLDTLIKAVDVSSKPFVQVCGCQCFTHLAEKHPQNFAWCLRRALPAVAGLVQNPKDNVKAAARAAMAAMSATTGNADLDPFLKELAQCMEDSSMVPATVEKLASVVFVRAVETPALALTVPVVLRGLAVRQDVVKRKACVIIDNMTKLVPHPREVHPFVDDLLPILATLAEEISDPEARSVAERTHKVMQTAKETEVGQVNKEALLELVRGQIKESVPGLANFVAGLCQSMAESRQFNKETWQAMYSKLGLQSELADAALTLCLQSLETDEAEEAENEDGEDLCNCVFTLGYGSLTLLNNTRLYLKRGMCYGLLGGNDCGKTTLMRAINNEQVDGFPPQTELRTAFVEHGIGESEPECDWLPEQYVLSEPWIAKDVEAGVLSKERITEELQALGFKPGDKLDMPLGKLSGGWKMKIGLVRAKLMSADIMMLDEPTGHLDVANIAWLTDYINSLKTGPKPTTVIMTSHDSGLPTGHLDVANIAWLTDYINSLKTGPKPTTVIMTSHDSGFLEKTVTHITHFQNRKLKVYKGSLSNFVEKVPEAKTYFILKADKLKFTFPEPGPLEGVKSRGRTLLQLKDCSFTYPGRPTPQLHGVGVTVSQLSRVAIVGPNGSGKSTMIKCLLGLLKPDSGTVWKQGGARIAYMAQHAFHHLEKHSGTVWKQGGARIAYMAQHAFHHLEKHIDLTPVQYVLQRFAGSEDNESLDAMANLGATKQEAEKKFMKCKLVDEELKECEIRYNAKGEQEYDPKDEKNAVALQVIQGRRKGKKSEAYEYEVKWVGMDMSRTWVPRSTLFAMGYKKECQREDEIQAARAGLVSKVLSTPSVEAHLGDFGLTAEFATHTPIRSLSAGQKVKAVLGACMWQNPHILVLDEPTNYLDRDALGALTVAIEAWAGGVLVISHNEEFCDRICKEKWIMGDGRLRKEGGEYEDEKMEEAISHNEEFCDRICKEKWIMGDGRLRKEGGEYEDEKMEEASKDQKFFTDAMGNVHEVKANTLTTTKDVKNRIKQIQKKLKDHSKGKADVTQDEVYQMEDELLELNQKLQEMAEKGA